jgi:hypothetical protein
MKTQEDSLRNQVALGWVLQLLVLAISVVFMIIDSVLMEDNFRDLLVDPGRLGLKVLTYIFAVYALMPVYVNLVHGLRARFFRWVAVGVAAVGFIYFLMHHLSHWQAGQRPTFTSHVFDLILHLIGLWVIANSIRWARSSRDETA